MRRFAEVTQSDLHGEPVLSWPGGSFDPQGWSSASLDDVASLRNAARRMSEAVEQREAKYKVANTALRQSIVDALVAIEMGHMRRPELPSPWSILEEARLKSVRDFNDWDDAVTGDVACGLAFDLGSAQWTQLVLQRVAEGLADARGIEVRPFLAAVTGNRPPMEAFSDDELSAEIERRIGPVRDPRKAVEEMIRRFGVHLDEWQRRILARLANPMMTVPAAANLTGAQLDALLAEHAVLVGAEPKRLTATEVRLRDEERDRATELLAQQGEWAHECDSTGNLVVTPLPQVCMHCRQMPPLTALRASSPRT